MIRVVLDASVLVSAVISPTGPNAQVFDLIVAQKIRPCLSKDVLSEYQRVFEYDRLRHLNRRRIGTFPSLMKALSIEVKPAHREYQTFQDALQNY